MSDLSCILRWGLVSAPSFPTPVSSQGWDWSPKVEDVLRAGNSNGGGSITTTTKNLTKAGSDPGFIEKTEEDEGLVQGPYRMQARSETPSKPGCSLGRGMAALGGHVGLVYFSDRWETEVQR